MDITVTTGRSLNAYEFYLDRALQLFVRVNGTDFDFGEWSSGVGHAFLKRIWSMFRRLFCVKIEAIAKEHHLDVEKDMIKIYYHFFKRHFRLDDTLPDIVETTQGMVINFELDTQPDCGFCVWGEGGCKPSADPDMYCSRFMFMNANYQLGVRV